MGICLYLQASEGLISAGSLSNFVKKHYHFSAYLIYKTYTYVSSAPFQTRTKQYFVKIGFDTAENELFIVW